MSEYSVCRTYFFLLLMGREAREGYGVEVKQRVTDEQCPAPVLTRLGEAKLYKTPTVTNIMCATLPQFAAFHVSPVDACSNRLYEHTQ